MHELTVSFELDRNLPLAIYRGTANDPTPFPPSSKTHGSYHWTFERLLSAALVPLTGAAFVTSGSGMPLLDGILGVSLVMHSHIGVCAAIHISNI
jgi:succinate dehydrogenase (ubiquinone) membrane anchor subunit